MPLLNLKRRAVDAVEGGLINLGLAGESVPIYLGDEGTNDFNDIYTDPNRNFDKSLTYVFRAVGNSNLSIDNETFTFQINPQSLQQDEEFAIKFFPTPQGITVEHQGSIMKDIVLTGVTGNHPRKASGGVDRKGNIILGRGDSGYKQLHDLRNFIRSYVELKKNPNNVNLVLEFYNLKDKEFFIVEPTKFSLKRDKGRPFMYEYTIMLKAIDRTTGFNPSTSFLDDALSNIDEGLDIAANIINVAVGFMNQSLAILSSFDRDIRAKVINPLSDLANGIARFRSGIDNVLNANKKTISDIGREIRAIGDSLSSKLGVADENYYEYRGLGSSPPSPNRPSFEELNLLNQLDKAKQALNILTSNNALFTPPQDTQYQDVNDVYGEDLVQQSPSTTRAQVLEGDTIERIAARELGDATRYKELVLLNGLKNPYIGEGERNIKVGDTLLIPSQSNLNIEQQPPLGSGEFEISRNLNPRQKELGIDIFLEKGKDIALSNSNDIDLVASVENVLQSLAIRLGVTKGDYRIHPDFGVQYDIGTKNTGNTLILAQEIGKQLARDPRLANNPRVTVTSQENILRVNIDLNIKATQQTIALEAS